MYRIMRVTHRSLAERSRRSLVRIKWLALTLFLVPWSAIARQAPPASKASEPVPQLVDITASTGIHFNHLSSPELRYIVESMSGGVALLDYDGDGWLDIYFTNAPSVSMARNGMAGRISPAVASAAWCSIATTTTAPSPTSQLARV